MATTEKNDMTVNNSFGFALKNLLNATKSKLSRKEWTVLLGVSDAAISQWISGKTFPESEKIKMILNVLRSYDLEEDEKLMFEHFLSVLEKPIDDLWSKVPSKMHGLKGSDYVLECFEKELRNSMSHLYYELKLELYQQLTRQIALYKKHLTENLLAESEQSGIGLHAKARKNRRLSEELANELNTKMLFKYADKVKSFNTFCNELLDKVLKDSEFESDSFNINIKEVLRNYEEGKYRNHKGHNVQGSFKVITSLTSEKETDLRYRMNDDLPQEVFSFHGFDIRSSQNEAYDISFKDPAVPDKDLLHIGISKISDQMMPMLMSKEKSVYCTFKYGRGPDNIERIQNPEVHTLESIKKCAIAWESEDHSPDFAMSFNFIDRHQEINKWHQSFPKLLKRILTNRSGNYVNRMNPYLIAPELTDSRYTVKILNVSKDSRVPITTSADNGFVFLIVGNAEVSSPNGINGFLSSLFDQNVDDKYSPLTHTHLFYGLDDQSEYEIYSHGCDSIALLVNYKDEHPLHVTKR